MNFRKRLSIDWWAVILATIFMLCVKAGLITTVPW